MVWFVVLTLRREEAETIHSYEVLDIACVGVHDLSCLSINDSIPFPHLSLPDLDVRQTTEHDKS